MTQEWLMRDNITPAETVVEMMFHSMPESMKAMYFGKQNNQTAGRWLIQR